MANIKKLHGVANIEIDKEEGELFIEQADGSGVVVDLNVHELMNLLDKFTEEEWGPSEVYGWPENPDV
jgi:hypothetical protein